MWLRNHIGCILYKKKRNYDVLRKYWEGKQKAIARAGNAVIWSWSYIWAIYLLKQLYLAQSSRAAAKTKCDRGRLKSRSIGHVRPRTVEIPSVSFLVIILPPTPPPNQYLNLLVEVWLLGEDGGINTWGWKIDSHWWKEILKVRCNTHVMQLLSL